MAITSNVKLIICFFSVKLMMIMSRTQKIRLAAFTTYSGLKMNMNVIFSFLCFGYSYSDLPWKYLGFQLYACVNLVRIIGIQNCEILKKACSLANLLAVG